MSETFSLYYPLGIAHITDLRGNDHIIFLVALCARYVWQDMRKLAVLITAFTIGHALTLALSILDCIHVPSGYTEFLIPLTILATGLSNLRIKKFGFTAKHNSIYPIALLFGLIHGLGFSNYLKSLLGSGKEVAAALLCFNLGIETGQLLIAAFALTATWIATGFFKAARREWLLVLSGAAIAESIRMAIERWPF